MIDLLRSEWIKFRSVRSTVVTLLLAGAIVVLVAVLVAVNTDEGAHTNLTGITGGVSFATLLFGVLG
ncbi:MAG: hypothetical protein KDA94_07595, partial [Acidimicrobiales bacterium]|nr:hypothetical protein [Acidimicrobiales bacterium]